MNRVSLTGIWIANALEKSNIKLAERAPTQERRKDHQSKFVITCKNVLVTLKTEPYEIYDMSAAIQD